MKTLKYPLLVVFILLSFSFFSCSSDDDDVKSSDLIGTWEVTNDKGYEKIDGKIEYEWDVSPDDKDFDTEKYWKFTEDGEIYSGDHLDKLYFDEYWVIKGNKLIRVEDDGEEISVTIKKLTSSELVLEETHIEQEDGHKYEFYNVLTFRKIK